MSSSLKFVWGEIQDFIFNPDYHQKFVVQSNILTPVICLSYYVFVSYIGPHFMRTRQPFTLKYTIIFYNALLVALNIFTFYGFATAAIRFRVGLLCPANPTKYFAELTESVKLYTWSYVMLKYIEFLDSIFFVMRKRFHLLSVLHRVHHAIVPVLCVISMRYTENICSFFAMMINSAIHVIMYSYYGLAVAGPRFKKYLWWKKYLTSLQIIQMIFNIMCIVSTTYTGCYPTKIPEILFLSTCTLFFVLFVNYFIHQWIKGSPKTKKKQI